MNNNKKQILYALIIVFVVSALSIAVVSFFNKGSSNADKKLSLKYNSIKSIKITNKLPISDELGKNMNENTDIKSYVTFDVVNDNDCDLDFDIYLTKKSTKHDIRGDYIKFYLTDENDNPLEGFKKNLLPSYKDLKVLNDKPASKLLYKDSIKKNSKKSYKLRVWISDSYAISDSLEEFYANLGVRSK